MLAKNPLRSLVLPLLTCLLMAIGCQVVIDPSTPQPNPPSLLDRAKVSSATVTIHPELASIAAKNRELVANDIPRKLEEAIMTSFSRGSYDAQSGGLSLEVEINQLLLSQWVPTNTVACETRVLDPQGNELKRYKSVSVSSRRDLGRLLTDLNRRIVSGL